MSRIPQRVRRGTQANDNVGGYHSASAMPALQTLTIRDLLPAAVAESGRVEHRPVLLRCHRCGHVPKFRALLVPEGTGFRCKAEKACRARGWTQPGQEKQAMEQTYTTQQVRERAAREGHSIRWTYKRIRDEALAAIPDAPTNQKEAILAALGRLGATRKASVTFEALCEQVPEIDHHDVTKALWALQKQALVGFRERKSGRGVRFSALYAIHLTPDGAALDRQRRTISPPAIPEEEVAQPLPEVDEEEPEPAQPFWTLADYPLIRDLMTKAVRAVVLRQAADLLEAGGEVDLALSVLDRVTLTPLEEEVVAFVDAVTAKVTQP